MFFLKTKDRENTAGIILRNQENQENTAGIILLNHQGMIRTEVGACNGVWRRLCEEHLNRQSVEKEN